MTNLLAWIRRYRDVLKTTLISRNNDSKASIQLCIKLHCSRNVMHELCISTNISLRLLSWRMRKFICDRLFSKGLPAIIHWIVDFAIMYWITKWVMWFTEPWFYWLERRKTIHVSIEIPLCYTLLKNALGRQVIIASCYATDACKTLFSKS